MKKSHILLTITLFLFAACPALLIGMMLIWQSILVQTNQTDFLYSKNAQIVSLGVNSVFQEAESQLRLMTEVLSGTELTRDQQRNILSFLLTQDGLYEELILLDNKGQEQIYLFRQEISSPTDSNDWSNTDEFLIPKTSGEVYYGPVSINEETYEPTVVISISFSDVDDNSVLIGKFRFTNVWHLIDIIDFPSDSNIYIVDGQNRIVAHPDVSIVLRGTRVDTPGHSKTDIGLNGDEVLLATDRIQLGEQELIIVIERPVSEVRTEIFNMVFTLVVTLIVILMIVVGLSLVTAYMFVRFSQRTSGEVS